MNGKKAKLLRKLAYRKTSKKGTRRYLINDKGTIIVDGPRHTYQEIKRLYKLLKELGQHTLVKEPTDV